MAKRLKPCPFCRGKAELLIVPGDTKSQWLVACKNKCCNQYPHKSEQDAIESWNTRVETERGQ